MMSALKGKGVTLKADILRNPVFNTVNQGQMRKSGRKEVKLSQNYADIVCEWPLDGNANGVYFVKNGPTLARAGSQRIIMGVAEHAPDARADFSPLHRWRQAAGRPFSIGNFMHCPTSDPPPSLFRR